MIKTLFSRYDSHKGDVCGRSDRRKRPTPIFSQYTFRGGRRKLVRRRDDKKVHVFVDLYSTRLMIAVLALICLSSLDAYLTLTLIAKGKVVEANPVMAYFLDVGIMHFTLTKFAITATALIILCIFKNVSITRISIPVALKIYLLVILYECYICMI